MFKITMTPQETMAYCGTDINRWAEALTTVSRVIRARGHDPWRKDFVKQWFEWHDYNVREEERKKLAGSSNE